ncbi:peptidoglycan bridge formation glycyltransferase FemA/FemB family protein [Candidatus Falkowbacteria bacterium]|nr:peptidoglycan bridge formation glycyltransferase FemA/FemB family protein [Candidatus Falkowbacteria bacterium]
MQFVKISDQKKYNVFLRKQKHTQFLQSWQWGEFQEKIGNKVLRVGVESAGELVVAATLVLKDIALGKKYIFSPRGPVFDHQTLCGKSSEECSLADTSGLEASKILFDGIEEIAKKEKAIFYRFEPTCGQSACPDIFKKTIDIEPSQTIVLDLSYSEKDILANMHQKTRYNIRLSERKEVEVKEARASERFDDFWSVMAMTCERDCFKLHSYEHYKKMLEIDSCFMKLFIAELHGKLLAAGIFSFFGDTVTYVHGASGNENREVMAPYLLQWHVIKLAKQAGFKYYDFYGIDEKKWPGVTRFKKGFRGQEVVYPGTFDKVYSQPIYNLYNLARKIRRIF